jgi:hypothetical protein
MSYKSVHTMGTEDMVKAMIDELPDEYDMKLNKSDMEALIWSLASHVGFVSVPECDPEGNCNGDCSPADKVLSLFSGIAETLNIEGV